MAAVGSTRLTCLLTLRFLGVLDATRGLGLITGRSVIEGHRVGSSKRREKARKGRPPSLP
jgi:hypothetical protein